MSRCVIVSAAPFRNPTSLAGFRLAVGIADGCCPVDVGRGL